MFSVVEFGPNRNRVSNLEPLRTFLCKEWGHDLINHYPPASNSPIPFGHQHPRHTENDNGQGFHCFPGASGARNAARTTGAGDMS